MQGGRPTPTALLSALYAVSGALCAVGAVHPMSSATPVGLLWALAAVGLAAGAVFWALGSRLTTRGAHAAVAAVSVLAGVLAWRSGTAVGIVGLGPVLIAVGLYAAHFFSPRAARLHVVLLVVAASLGAWAAAPSGFFMAWVVVVVATVVLTDIQARLAQHLRTRRPPTR